MAVEARYLEGEVVEEGERWRKLVPDHGTRLGGGHRRLRQNCHQVEDAEGM